VLPLSDGFPSIPRRKRFLYGLRHAVYDQFALCGFAPNLPMLLSSRSSGAGARIATDEQAILADTFLPKEAWLSRYGAAVVVAPDGPPLWMDTDNFSWRWIFFVISRLNSLRCC